MELAELIIKILYVVVLYFICYYALNASGKIHGNTLLVTSILLSVLIVYITFKPLYNFLLNNELIVQVKDTESGSDSESSSNNKPSYKSKTQIENSKNVNNKNSSEYNMNHTHKYIQDQVFN